MTDFLARFGVAHPIIQAPMAGGATTTELVSAVCNAGALGSLAAALFPPQKILDSIAALRAVTDRPFNVNLFVLDAPRADEPEIAARITRAEELLAPIRRELGLADRKTPAKFCERFEDQLAAVLEAAPAVVSFTFGVVKDTRGLKKKGCAVIGTATNIAEARAWEEAGADAICAQGAEAGAHRGTFIGAPEDSMIPLAKLVPLILG
ncbi:MAG: NAD(P)H-dependent flavin oxidoreductase, partial [Burkholderiales bacterium]